MGQEKQDLYLVAIEPETHHSTNAGIFAKESVRIALTYAAIINIDVNAADIRNAYLHAPKS